MASEFLSDSLLEWLDNDAEEPDENSMDSLVLVAFDAVVDEYTTPNNSAQPPRRPLSSSTPNAAKPRPFAAPKTKQEIADARLHGIPKKTQEDTEYCKRLWNEWCKYRQQSTGDCIPGLTDLLGIFKMPTMKVAMTSVSSSLCRNLDITKKELPGTRPGMSVITARSTHILYCIL